MEGLVEIKQWLHVWTEAERAARLKKPGCEARAKDRSEPVREDGETVRLRTCEFPEHAPNQRPGGAFRR